MHLIWQKSKIHVGCIKYDRRVKYTSDAFEYDRRVK